MHGEHSGPKKGTLHRDPGEGIEHWQGAKSNFSASKHPTLQPSKDPWNDYPQRKNHLCACTKRAQRLSPSSAVPSFKRSTLHILYAFLLTCAGCKPSALEKFFDCWFGGNRVQKRLWQTSVPSWSGGTWRIHWATLWDHLGHSMPRSPCSFFTLFCY